MKRLRASGCAVLCLLIAGCQSRADSQLPRIPASGVLAGEMIDTPVDSEAARYYLEEYLQGQRRQPEIDRALAEADHRVGGGIPGRDELQALTQQFSTDLAALYFATKVLAQPQNRHFRAIFRAEMEKIRSGTVAPLPVNTPSSRVLYVPGWLYRTDPGSGADMADSRRVTAGSGAEAILIEVPESGTIETNAEHVAQAILRYSQDGRVLTLVSASKGGPEIGQALSLLETARKKHAAALWINAGGLLQGSPLADFGMRWPQRWLAWLVRGRYGWNLPSIASMKTGLSRERYAHWRLPPGVLIVNYLGVPMASQVTARAHDGYHRMRPLGPNDGLTLLPDAIAPNSLTLLALGQDHFMRNRDPDVEALALPRAILRWVGETQKAAPQQR